MLAEKFFSTTSLSILQMPFLFGQAYFLGDRVRRRILEGDNRKLHAISGVSSGLPSEAVAECDFAVSIVSQHCFTQLFSSFSLYWLLLDFVLPPPTQR